MTPDDIAGHIDAVNTAVADIAAVTRILDHDSAYPQRWVLGAGLVSVPDWVLSELLDASEIADHHAGLSQSQQAAQDQARQTLSAYIGAPSPDEYRDELELTERQRAAYLGVPGELVDEMWSA